MTEQTNADQAAANQNQPPDQSQQPPEEQGQRQETNAERAKREREERTGRSDAERFAGDKQNDAALSRFSESRPTAGTQSAEYAGTGAMQYGKGPNATMTVREAEMQRRDRMGEPPPAKKAPALSGGLLEPHRPAGENAADTEAGFLEMQRTELERATAKAEAEGYELVSVRSIRPDDKVALYEVGDEHPNGVAFVAGRMSRPIIVARTPEVEAALGRRDIQIVERVSSPSR